MMMKAFSFKKKTGDSDRFVGGFVRGASPPSGRRLTSVGHLSEGAKQSGFMDKLTPKFGNAKKTQYPEYKGDLVGGKACGKVLPAFPLTLAPRLSVGIF